MARLDMRGNFLDIRETSFVTDEWEILGTANFATHSVELTARNLFQL